MVVSKYLQYPGTYAVDGSALYRRRRTLYDEITIDDRGEYESAEEATSQYLVVHALERWCRNFHKATEDVCKVATPGSND